MQGRVNTKRIGQILTVLFITIVAGCSPQPRIEQRTTGYVAFHNTEMRMGAAVTLDDHNFITDDGNFTLAIRPGKRAYDVMTLLGLHTGVVSVGKDDDTIRLHVPPFAGWSPLLFDNIAFTPGRDFTIRWPWGRKIDVWIQPFTPASHRAATDALHDWQTILKGTVTFSEVNNYMDADMTIRFVPQTQMPDYETIGTCTRWYKAATGLIVRAEMSVSRAWASHIGLHRHEIGHCLGLGHTPEEDEYKGHLMYPVIYNTTLTPTEQDAARLLYSIAPKTPPVHKARVAAQDGDHHMLHRFTDPTGQYAAETVR